MSSNKRSNCRLKSLFTRTADCGGCSRQNSVTADYGGCSLQNSATAAPAQPKPRPKAHPPLLSTGPPTHSHPFVTTSSAINSSVAIEKDSDDPYNDFRQSMLQMIFEKEMYSRDDLQELLNCFLKMNSADHRDVIVRAFTEIMSHDGPICVSSRHISENP